MTWSKLSDDFSDDCWSLSDEAFRLHVEGIVWSNRKLLDLRIPKDDVRRFASHGDDGLKELLDVGFWADEDTHWIIRHHGSYQRTREAVVNQQAANERNGKKGGRPRRELAADIKKTESVSEHRTGSHAPRQQGGVPSVATPARITQSVSESPSESETQRDRPGQDRALDWKYSSEKPCLQCGRPLSEDEQWRGDTCDRHAAPASRRSA